MNNDSNAVRGRHLESLANMFIGKFTSVDSIVAGLLEEISPFTGATSIRGGTDGLVPAPAAGDEVKFLCGDGTWSTVDSGSCILDTVCPSVNGGMWYEVANGTPVVKIYYNGIEYPLGGANETSLSVIPSPLNVPVGGSATATVDCSSGGEITAISLTEGVQVERSGNVITVHYAAGIDTASVKISSAATLGYTPAEILLPVRMAAADPNLTVTLTSSSTINSTGTATATVSYASACTATPDITANPNVPYTYENGVISVPYADIDGSVTFTVSLTESPGYLAATETFTVTMANTHLTVSPATATIAPDGTATFTVSYNGGGTANLTSDNARIYPTYSTLPGTITVPYYAFPTDTTVTFTVSVAANNDYPAETTTFTVFYAGVDELVVCMPFTNSLYEDFCGNTYSAHNNEATLANGAARFPNDKARGILMGSPVKMSFGGQDGTVRFWFLMNNASAESSMPFQLHLGPNAGKGHPGIIMDVIRNSNYLTCNLRDWDTSSVKPTLSNIAYSFGTWAHFEADYTHSSGLWRIFLNGNLVGTLTKQYARLENERKIIIGSFNGNESTIFVGYVDEVQIYDGVALHTANFTPPARSSA